MPARFSLRYLRLGTGLIALAAALGFVFTVGDPVNGEAPSVLERAAYGWVPAAVWVTLAARAWRSGVFVSEDGVMVRNFWTTRRFRIDHVDRFEVASTRVSGLPVAALRDSGGRLYRSSVIRDPNPWFSRGPTAGVVERMNAELVSVQGRLRSRH